MAVFSDLIGKNLTGIESTMNSDNETEMLTFTCDDGVIFKMFHSQDCCEGVILDDTVGNLGDLIGTPILRAEEAISDNINPEGVPIKDYQDSFTWTFYHISTIKGTVTLRWYGESNGYYSESVEFVRA